MAKPVVTRNQGVPMRRNFDLRVQHSTAYAADENACENGPRRYMGFGKSMTRKDKDVVRRNRAASRGKDARLIKAITGTRMGAVNGSD